MSSKEQPAPSSVPTSPSLSPIPRTPIVTPTSRLSCLIKEGRDILKVLILNLLIIRNLNYKSLQLQLRKAEQSKFAAVSSTYKNVDDESITSYIQDQEMETEMSSEEVADTG